MYILLVFLALGSVSTHDINVGSSTGGKKVFDEHFQASPAVWRQAQNVTVNTTDDEVISRIVVTDLREEKDGDAKIVDGGEGQKKVTIELKSPTVLRGYDFKVEVYAELNKDFQHNSLNKNGPAHPSEFKTNDPNSANKGTSSLDHSLDATTKLYETPKIQSFPLNTGVKVPTNARETRDTEVKKQEKPKIDAPSIFGQHNKQATTISPVTINSRLYTEDEESSTKTDLVKDKKNNDEVRHVRDTHDDITTAKYLSKTGSFDGKTSATTTTYKTPTYTNLNRDNPTVSHPVSEANDREVRATHKDDEHVSPTLVPSQRNPTVYTPSFEENVPSLLKTEADKPVNDKKNIDNQKRSSRDTRDESKEISSPKVLSDGLKTDNITKDEERKTRSAQFGLKVNPNNGNVKVSSTAVPTQKKDDEKSENDNSGIQSPLNPLVLTRSPQNPVPYPYEGTTKATTTTKSPHKRDTEPLGSKADDKTTPKLFGSPNATTHDHKTKTPVVSLQ